MFDPQLHVNRALAVIKIYTYHDSYAFVILRGGSLIVTPQNFRPLNETKTVKDGRKFGFYTGFTEYDNDDNDAKLFFSTFLKLNIESVVLSCLTMRQS